MRLGSIDNYATYLMYLKSDDSVPESLLFLLESVRKMNVKIKLVLVDREFFSVDCIKGLQENKVPFLMPCKNTGNVVAALEEYASKKRVSGSENVIENSNSSAKYNMLITKRTEKKKKKKKKADNSPLKPKERYIGFATNTPTQDVKKYASRWGIETGYRMIEEMRPRTRITNVCARIMCFNYALVAYNIWIILRILYSDDSSRRCVMTQLYFKLQLSLAHVQEPKPPP